MTFETIRVIISVLIIANECDLYDYKVIIYSLEPLRIAEPIAYKDIPDCFNCKVHAFDFDLDKKIIFIRSEVVNNDKI